MSIWVIVLAMQPLWGQPSDKLIYDRGYQTEEHCRQVIALANGADGLACREIKVSR